MLHIFLTILKIPLILLALALILLLAAILLALFVPVRYQARLAKEEELNVTGRVHWLLHLVSVRADYAEKKMELTVRICGYPLIGGKKKPARSDTAEEPPAAAEKQDSRRESLPEAGGESSEPAQTQSRDAEAEPAQKQDTGSGADSVQAQNRDVKPEPAKEQDAGSGTDPVQAQNQDVKPEPAKEQDTGSGTDPVRTQSRDAEPGSAQAQEQDSRLGTDPLRTQSLDAEPGGDSAPAARHEADTEPSAVRKPRVSIIRRIRRIRDKIRNTYRRLLEKIKNIRESVRRMKSKLDSFLDLWYDEHTQTALTHTKSEIFYILKHYLPGRMEGRLLFGLSDPASTGQVLGLLCILQVFTGNHLQVEADFERAVLQGEVSFKGHVRTCHLIKSGLSLLLDRHCRITFGRVRKFINRKDR